MVDRVYQRNATAAPPAVPDAPSEGYPTNGNPAGAIPATIPGAYWYHMITESLRNVIVAAGLDPDHEDLGQLVEALQSMGLGGYASAVDAQALSSLTKILTPGTLGEAFKGGNQQLGIAGYQVLPGGLIFQWGHTSMTGPDSTGSSNPSESPDHFHGVVEYSAAWPIPFPTSVFCAFSSTQGSGAEGGELVSTLAGVGTHDLFGRVFRLAGSNKNDEPVGVVYFGIGH